MENQGPIGQQPTGAPYTPPSGPYTPPRPQPAPGAQLTPQPQFQSQPAAQNSAGYSAQLASGTYPPPAQPAPNQSAYPYPNGTPQGSSAGNKRKFILLGAVVGGLIALAGGGTYAFSKLNSVSAEDFKLATTASSELETKLRDVSFDATSVNSLALDDTSKDQEIIAKAKSAIADYEKAVQEFESQKALRDDEISQLHDKFTTKNAAYIKAVKAFNSDLEKALPALTRCQGGGSRADVNATVKQLEACAAGLDTVTGLQDPNMKLVVDATKELAQNGSTTLKRYQQATTSRNYTEASKLFEAYYDAQDTALDKASKADEALRKAFDNSNPTKELQSLTNKLSSKSFEA